MDNIDTTVQAASSVAGFASPEWIPHAYQSRGIDWLLQLEAALFLPPGLGKTSITLAAILKLKEVGENHRTLLVAPLKVCQTTWMTEPKKWRQFQGLRVGLAWGPDRELVLKDPYYDIVVINYDGLAWAVPSLMKGHQFGVLACDELTRLKNTNSKRFKILKSLLITFKFRWGLTGTPAANGVLDLFGQVYVLDSGKRLGKFITHFRNLYFHQQPWDKFNYYITPGKSAQLLAKLEDLAMYVSPEEWLELPDFIPVLLSVELPAEIKRQYDALEDDYLMKLEGANVVAANAGVLTSKLRQITGGAVYTSEGVYSTLDTTKLDALDDLLEELAGEPLMLSYQFDHERQRILERHPKALCLKGGMSQKATQEVIDTWNNGTAPLLLVQPSSAALGLNLQFGGAAICWFTITYNLEEFIQLNKRLHRQGQVKNVRCYMLTAKGTIDEHVNKVLVKKDATQNEVFEALKLKM
jgi:SNF2 family DNA or RNA helicase